MRIVAVVLVALAGLPAAHAAPVADPVALRHAECVRWMMTGYPSGLEETSCTAQFDLPSPFLFKCVQATRRGYDSNNQRLACATFLSKASSAAEGGYVRQP